VLFKWQIINSERGDPYPIGNWISPISDRFEKWQLEIAFWVLLETHTDVFITNELMSKS
jgi:hypothetical protein